MAPPALGALMSLAWALPVGAVEAPSHDWLAASWAQYVRAFVQEDGRVVDRARDDLSTSEGEAYAMLRAVWVDDQPTVDRVRTWTLDNLQRSQLHALPAWKWGRRDDGTWGVLDAQAAADADLLMAWALLIAADRWQVPALQEQAVGLLHAIWEQEVALVAGRYVLLPGPWARGLDPLPVNPSYLVPSAFRAAAVADPAHPWGELVDSTYAVLDASFGEHGLVSDWLWLDAVTGRAVLPPKPRERDRDFGYEAHRVPWNLAADAAWTGDARAERLLDRLEVLAREFEQHGRLRAVVDVAGNPRVPWEPLALYGALAPVWAVRHPELLRRLLVHLNSGRADVARLDYYAANWVWFGLALWSGLARPLESP